MFDDRTRLIAADSAAATTQDISITIDLSGICGRSGKGIDLYDAPGAANGSCEVRGGAEITYRPVAGFVGTDRISFQARDRRGKICATHVDVNVDAVACFTPGTKIATPKGERRVENLKAGDKVITRDNGIQEIRWAGAKPMTWKQLAANAHLKPVLIQAGSLGNGLPETDMMVSPNHRIMVSNDRTALYFQDREVLVSAKHLAGNQGVQQVETMGTTYLHLMFDNHEMVLANGTWTESFQPGDYTLKAVGNAQRTEIFELFPELATPQGRQDYLSARHTVSEQEARVLF